MFNELTRFLFEYKQLALPQIGILELKHKDANADIAGNSIASPGWIVSFSENVESENIIDNNTLFSWLAADKNTSAEVAQNDFENFVTDIKHKLDNAETVIWKGLGMFETNNNTIVFIPEQEKISPFTDVVAKKVIRENSSYSSIVGDKETTTAQMREELFERDNNANGKNKIMWLLFAAAAIVVTIYFSQNGCNLQGTGNRQKVNATTSGDTYQLK